jgi:hypothetical protein
MYKDMAMNKIITKIIEDGIDIPYIDLKQYVFDNYVDGKEDDIVSAVVDEIRADVIW